MAARLLCSGARMPTLQPEPGVALHYEVSGEGRPVVLVHGWSMSSRALAPLAAALSAKGRRCLALDLRGHGRSSTAARHGLEDHARDLAALCAHERVDGAVLVGWSMGGQVVLEAL